MRPDDPGRRAPQPSLGLIAVVAVVVLVLFLLWRADRRPAVPPPELPPPGQRPAPPQAQRTPPPPPAGAAGTFLFCTWNVENFFDDEDDPSSHDEDEDWFASNPDLVHQKVRRLADGLLMQNDGRGPDIAALIEVESHRCVELLQAELNARLSAGDQYRGIVFVENRTGRRFAPAVLTRLDTREDLTRGGRAFGNRRILEAHLVARGAPLVVLASHWTSRVTDETDAKRSAYADAVYAEFLDLTRLDPLADVILSGDFNDEPEDVAVTDHLHAVADPALVRAGGARPPLLDLVMGRDPKTDGTYFYNKKWQFLDHILASPGLLDPAGWQVLPDTIHTENAFPLRARTNRAPLRFGNPKSTGQRGYSDHFALTVRLRVQPAATQ